MRDHTSRSSVNHVKSILRQIKTGELPFKEILSDELLSQTVETLEYRDRVFTPDMTIFAFLAQVMGQDQSCSSAVAQVVAHFVGSGKTVPSMNTAAYCKARARLPEEVLSGLAKETASRLEAEVKAQAPQYLWRGRSIKLPDGTGISMPDTAENQAIYPQAKTQKKGVGFPIARMVGIFSLSTGTLLNLAIAPWSGKETGEHALLREIISCFKKDDIMIADAYYGSFFLIAMLIKMGVDVVVPQNGARLCDLRRGKHLNKGDHLIEWTKPVRPHWMSKEDYAEFPKTITVRETKIVSNKPGFRVQTRIIVSTFIDDKQVTSDDLSQLYSYRWFVELDLRSVKQTMCMDVLRCKTPSMVRKEIWAHILAYNLARKVMLQSAILHQRKPREMSFKLTLQLMSAFRQAGILSEYHPEYFTLFLRAIASKKVGQQKRGAEPRVVKRRPKAFPRMQKPRAKYKKENSLYA